MTEQTTQQQTPEHSNENRFGNPRAQLEWRLQQLQRVIYECEREIAKAKDDYGHTVRRLATVRTVQADEELSRSRTRISLAEFRLEGAQKNFEAEQKHQQAKRFVGYLERFYKNAQEAEPSWEAIMKAEFDERIAELAKQRFELLADVQKRYRAFAKPYSVLQTCMRELGLDASAIPIPAVDVTKQVEQQLGDRTRELHQAADPGAAARKARELFGGG